MPEKTPPLRACVRRSLDTYFKELGDTETQNLHALVVAEVEKPLLEAVPSTHRWQPVKSGADTGNQPQHPAKEARPIRIEMNPAVSLVGFCRTRPNDHINTLLWKLTS